MATNRVTSKIGSGLFMAQSRTHQYFVAGSKGEGWTVNAVERNGDGIPQSAKTQTIAVTQPFFKAEQAIIDHWNQTPAGSLQG